MSCFCVFNCQVSFVLLCQFLCRGNVTVIRGIKKVQREIKVKRNQEAMRNLSLLEEPHLH